MTDRQAVGLAVVAMCCKLTVAVWVAVVTARPAGDAESTGTTGAPYGGSCAACAADGKPCGRCGPIKVWRPQ